jgi:hypothetical protein
MSILNPVSGIVQSVATTMAEQINPPTDGILKPTAIFKSSSAKPIQQLSPVKISVNEADLEGDLPRVDPEHRKLITDYLLGKTTISTLNITKSNCKEFLRSIKIIDLDLDRFESSRKDFQKGRSTYELRTLCIMASEGTMPTYEAYTRSINPDYFKNPFSKEAMEYAAKEENYVPERVRLHARVTQNYVIQALQLSRRLSSSEPTIYALRGNTAAGKSSKAKLDKEFQKGLDEGGEATGSLNPDTIKFFLRKNIDGVTNQQIHAEGCGVWTQINGELLTKTKSTSYIIDERLAKAESLSKCTKSAEKQKGSVVLKDIDAPLMLSCLRVLSRDVRLDPCVPYGPIASGYAETRQYRGSIIEVVKNNPLIKQYDLYVTAEDGQSILTCQKRDGVFTILNEKLYQKATTYDKGETETVKTTKISKELIGEFKPFGLKTETLEGYIGLTIEQALLKHSLKTPVHTQPSPISTTTEETSSPQPLLAKTPQPLPSKKTPRSSTTSRTSPSSSMILGILAATMIFASAVLRK